jgi:hypothetical protein
MQVIVTTTIHPVTEAIERFQVMAGWHLIVVGDRKTPGDYHLQRGTYVSCEDQEKRDRALSDAIGWNCIQRRNFGLLWAHDMGADVVAVVDDDNIPYEGWGEDLMVGRNVEVNYYSTDLPAFDPVGATNESALWHRGYPLPLVAQRTYSAPEKKMVRADIQADFWDGDPDVDAICRMEHRPECKFDPRVFPIAGNKMSPFDSQNTFLRAAVLRDYFLFPHVGRMDDIWAAYYVQAKGFRVIYGKASVYQRRNEHDLIRDMKQEYLGYENNLRLVQDLSEDPERILQYLPPESARAFALYKSNFSDNS